MIRTVLRHRLVHFLAIGGVLFALAPKEPKSRAVVIDPDRTTAALRAAREQRGRALSGAEHDRAIADAVDEEILAREALRAGLGPEDPILRARLADRMREALTRTLPPIAVDDAEVDREAALLAASAPELTRIAVHYYRNEADAAAGTEARAPIPDDRFWSETELAKAAGPNVARAAMGPLGQRSALVSSAWGLWALVPVERRKPSAAEMRASALRAVRARHDAEAMERALAKLRTRYDVVVRSPEPEPATRVD